MQLYQKVFLIIKAVQLALIAVVPVKFDTSSDNYLAAQGLKYTFLNNFIVWDNVYFNKLFNDSKLIFEHEFVFSPYFTRLIQYVPASFYIKLAVAMVITNVSHLLTCQMVTALSRLYFPKKEGIAEMSGVFCALSTAGVFLTASYSESLCALLTVSSLYLRESSLTYQTSSRYTITNFKKYLCSGLLIAMSFGVRSNSLLFGIIYLYDSAQFLARFRIRNAIQSLFTGFTIFVSLSESVGAAYMEFCPERGEWCYYRIPSLAYYAQSHYWNNGFLNYWTSNNIPNFLVIIPTFAIFTSSVYFFIRDARLRPIVLVSVVYLVLNLFFWHAQIMNRISTFIPLNYLYLAHSYNSDKRTTAKAILIYNVIWIVVQCGLFAAFLPPA